MTPAIYAFALSHLPELTPELRISGRIAAPGQMIAGARAENLATSAHTKPSSFRAPVHGARSSHKRKRKEVECGSRLLNMR